MSGGERVARSACAISFPRDPKGGWSLFPTGYLPAVVQNVYAWVRRGGQYEPRRSQL